MMPSGKAYAAGALAYSLATFNGGYLWHIVLFNEQFLNLKTWSRFDDPSSSLAMVAVALQVRTGTNSSSRYAAVEQRCSPFYL